MSRKWTSLLAKAGAVGVLACVAPAAAADPADQIFDPAAVAEIDLSIPPASREALAEEPGDYAPATFALSGPGGAHGPMPAEVRLKGSTSFRTLDGKAAFKVRFRSAPGGRFLGLKSLTLNNMVQDPSMLHEGLAYELFRTAGVPAPRTGYSYVRVDGQDFGVYLSVETIDDIFLKRWVDSTEHLYEGGPGADATPERMEHFEVDEGDDEDLADLEALTAAAGGSGTFSQRIAPVADLSQMVRMWAIEKYIAHWDGYTAIPAAQPNNFYLHSDEEGRFRMLPWGTDQTFGDHLPFVGPHGVLFAECLAEPLCEAVFRAEVMALPALSAEIGLEARAAATAELLAPWQALDPRREHTLAEIAAGVADTRDFIATRPADLKSAAHWGKRPGSGGREAPVVDRTAPETTITAGPRDVVRKAGERRRVRIEFAADEDGARFECRLDDASFSPCVSPARPSVRPGRHAFRVRAIDAAGNVDPSPALRRWRVRR